MHPFLSAVIGGALIGFSVVLLMFFCPNQRNCLRGVVRRAADDPARITAGLRATNSAASCGRRSGSPSP